ncbi:conserved hypothetical protein [Tenacibaculum sp. 190524A02b]|uniref:Class I SAM-dependent methyltransferase n=1 Tax=Tenacibaculum vairaonense TaxID=3137860 RepID=A0ABP1FCR5_9FLAO
MKRVQLFEFEDFSWLPKFIRASITNLLALLLKKLKTQEIITSILQDIQTKHSFNQIVDLGAGSGGVMLDVVEEYNKNRKLPIKLLLTDLFPNPKIINQINNSTPEYIYYSSAPTNATNFETVPEGLKTMMNSFHHMSPENAKKILKTAQLNKQPILIYEMGINNIPLVFWWLFLPISILIMCIMVFFMTPFVKNITFKQVIFTYLIPVIPLIYAWDGQASLVRMYTFKDIETHLLANLPKDNSYTWKIDTAKNSEGKTQGYYILGLPIAE